MVRVVSVLGLDLGYLSLLAMPKTSIQLAPPLPFKSNGHGPNLFEKGNMSKDDPPSLPPATGSFALPKAMEGEKQGAAASFSGWVYF